MRVVLASTSPRRRTLLTLLGFTFEVRNPVCDEQIIAGRSASELASSFAQQKAHSVAAVDPEAVVIGCDTLIELDGTVLGKPADMEDARRTLRALADRRHQVHTAVAVVSLTKGFDKTRLATAQVRMKPYDACAHEQYLATGDSLGKAGAYSIQGPGRGLIESLEGDFTTVVGLPLRLAHDLLTQVGVTLAADIVQVYRQKPYENWAQMSLE
jgi:septum formation protein